MSNLTVLGPSSSAPEFYDHAWFQHVGRSPQLDPSGWVTEVAAQGALSDDQAWQLLGWVEMAASQSVRSGSRETLVTASFGWALTLQSELDPRECLVVACLLRRAAAICGFDYLDCVAEGCSRAGAAGREALPLLRNASDRTPPTHEEIGAGESFEFIRLPSSFAVEDLERWLEE
jgi:hypothetical protein